MSDKCPKCGASSHGSTTAFSWWLCGSADHGSGFYQTDRCRIAELEHDIADALAFLFNITPTGKQEMKDSLDEQIEVLRVAHQVEVERLKADAHEMRGLLETAHDAMEPMQRPPVSPSWLVAVGWIIEKGVDDD